MKPKTSMMKVNTMSPLLLPLLLLAGSFQDLEGRVLVCTMFKEITNSNNTNTEGEIPMDDKTLSGASAAWVFFVASTMIAERYQPFEVKNSICIAETTKHKISALSFRECFECLLLLRLSKG